MEVVYVRICVEISRQYIILPVEINLSSGQGTQTQAHICE